MARRHKRPVKAKGTRTKKPGAKPPPDPSRQTRHAIALQMGMADSLVQRHAAKPNAPKPDKWKRYDTEQMVAFIKAESKWAAGTQSPEVVKLKDRKLQLEVEEQEHRMAALRGETIRKKDVTETVEALGLELFGMIKQKFVNELPPKYQGKNEVERRQMNESAYNEITAAFREGTHRIETQVGAPA